MWMNIRAMHIDYTRYSNSLTFYNVSSNYDLLPIQNCKHSSSYFPRAKVRVAFNHMYVKQIENTSE